MFSSMLKKFSKPRSISRWDIHQPDTPILDLSGVNTRFNGKYVLEDISFQLIRGEYCAVVGPNGAGKSTLFKVIAGILHPTSGTVAVYGATPGQHICIAYLPQRSQVDWDFPVSVADVVMMGRIGKLGPIRLPSRRDHMFVLQALELVGLDAYSRRQISELSGGQQQRMFIARALAQEAELLLMDEPLSGLDDPAQKAIFSLMNELHKRGVTIMVAMHDLKLASEHFDRVMLLNRRILGFGTPKEVLTADQLVQAYGDHLRLVELKGELYALGDTCCEEGAG